MRLSAPGTGTSTALAAALVLGCSDISAPRVGTLVVTVSTQGATPDLDPDGYTLAIDNGVTQIVAVNSSVTFPDVPTGDYSATLTGLAPNCSINGNGVDTQTIEVIGRPVMIQFFVTCAPRTGTVRISTTTSGSEPDADGYSVLVGGVSRAGVPVNGSFDVLLTPEGNNSVELRGVAGNCSVDAPNPRTVSVVNGAVVQVDFVIRCVPSASLTVTIATSGVSPDPNGYELVVTEESRQVVSGAVPANTSLTISGLRGTTYVVTLTGIAANCDVSTSNRRAVTLVSGSPNQISIDVICETPRQLAYVSWNHSGADIHVIRSNGSDNFRLTDHAEGDLDPAWSADGSRIAFTSNRDGNYEVYVMAATGGNQVRLTNAPGADHLPTWSPDGSKIAFVSDHNGNTDIYAMNADGTSPVRLTTDPGLDTDPAWSPDGRTIAFRSEQGGTSGIWIMNADGSGRTRLTSSQMGDYQPAWSPDGTRIAFSSGTGNYTRDIVLINADGSGRTELTVGYENAQDPSWSSDGRKIAFTAYTYYYNTDIVLVSMEGIPYSPLMTSNSGTNPVWRP